MKRTLAKLSVIFSLIVLSYSSYATLTLKINNKIQADLTLEVGCTSTDMFFIGTVQNNPPAIPYSYPTPRWTGSGATYLNDVNADFVTFNCPNPGDYEITYSAIKSGITYSITQTIRVLAKDILSLDFPLTSPYNMCEGSSVSLQASGTSNYYWERELGGVTDVVGFTATVDETPPSFGSWTYRVYGWNDGCASDPDHIEFQIDVDEAPTADAGGTYSACSGGSVVLNGSIGGSASSAQWVGGAGVFTPDRNALNATYTPHASESGTDVVLILRTDDPAGVCSYAESSATVTVHSLPVVTLSSFADVCLDASAFVLSGGSPSGGTYSGTGVSGENFDPSVAGVGTHIITYTYTDGNGCTNFTTNTIKVNALPVVTLSAFSDICVNASPITLSGGSPVGGTYSGTGVSGGTFDPSVAGVGTHTITYSYTDGNGCTNFATNTIDVNDLPVVTLSSFADVCVDGSPFALSGGSPLGGAYSGTGVSGGNFDPSTAGVGTHTISYTYTDGNGCVNSATNTITVRALPSVTLSAFADVCLNSSSFALSGGSPAGGTYSGTGVSGGNFDPSIAGVGTYTITYTYIDPSGCVNSATNTITVNPLPTQYSVTGGGTYCAGDAGALVGLSDSESGVTYTLYKDGAPTTTTVAGTGNAISFGPQTTGTYTVSAAVDATGCTNAMIGSVVVSQIPAITGNTVSASQTICLGTAPAQLTGPVPTGGSGSYSYRWQISTAAVSGPFTNIPGASSRNYTPPTLTQTSYYRRVVTSGSCISISNVLTITVNPVIANNTITADQSICYNTAPSQLTGTTPTGGNGTYSYIWQSSTAGAAGPFSDITGATSINYQPGNLTQDTWFRRVVLSPPCSDNTSNVVAIAVSPAFTVSGFTTTDPTCNGYSDGSATANLTGGIAPYTFSWNTTPVQTNQTATGLSAGITYTVTVTDATLCVATGDVTLAEPAAIALSSVTPTDVTGCYGDTNGSIQIEGTGGTPNYTYTLFEGSTQIGTPQTPVFPAGANFTGLGAGSYSVVITDVNSCPAHTETNIVVSEPAELVISDVQTTSISCAGYTDGTITIVASGGTGALEYTIDGLTYQSSNVFTVGEGYYDISVRDANGCTTSWPVQIEMVEPSAISFNYEITNITSCNGDSAGKISISNVSGGSGTGYEYSIYIPEVWGTNPLFENLPGGITNPYYIKVKDSYGCIEVGNNGNPIYINQPAPITFNVVTTDVTTCWYNTNGTIRINSVAGGTGSKQVSIDGVTYYPTTKVFNVGVGTYTVYVRDTKGCIATKPAVISGPPAIVVDAVTVTDATCFGAANGAFTATASGGNPPLEYSIDGINYYAVGSFTGLTGGTHTLSVRDANGCILEQDVVVGQPPVLYFTQQNVAPITCNGANDGTITLAAAGGNAPYSYSITGGGPYSNTTGSFTGLSAATYTVAVLDNRGCEVIGNDLTVTEPDPITITAQSFTDILCFGGSNGTISVTAEGGTNPLIYNLIDGGSNVVATNSDGNFTGVALGIYTVEVDDAHGCGPVPAGPFPISQPALLDFTYTTVDLTCYNDGTGQITVNASGGIAPYEYSFDGGTTFVSNNVQGGLNGGDFTVVVRDANGCQTSKVVTIVAPAELILTLDVTNITCNGLSDGQIIANASGGDTATPYQYRIDGGAWQLGNTFTPLAEKSYFVEVIDASGCIDGASADIVAPMAISIDNITPVNPTCTSKGSITVTASGGTGTLTYTLNPGAIQTNTTGVFNDLDIGNYTVDVTDVNGCFATTSVSLTAPPAISLNDVIVTNVGSCYGNSDGSITIDATGGTAPLQYSIDNGANFSTNNVFSGLPAGTYDIVVNDINNCPQDSTVTITEPIELIITSATVTQETAAGSGDGSINVVASGGTGILTYTLQPIGTVNNTGVFNGLGAGTYQVVVTDANGCSKQTGDLVISGVSITVTPTMVSCYGLSDGKIQVTIAAGFPPFTVACTRVSEMQSMPVTNPNPGEYLIESLPADTFMITITDATFHAFPSRQVIITQPDTLVVTYLQKINPLCNGGTGSVVFDIDGGTPIISGTDSLYFIDLINSGLVERTDTGSTSTEVRPNIKYDFKIYDTNGCFVVVDTIQPLTEPEAILVTDIVTSNINCNGDSTGSIVVTLTGGVQPYEYIVTTGVFADTVTDGNFSNLPAGSYTLSITDGNRCPAVVTQNPIELTEPTPILITGGDFPVDSLTCPYDRTGYVHNIVVTGGTPNPTAPEYTYLWTSGATTLDVDNLPIGIHTLTVTDANGCQQDTSYEIIGPKPFRLVCEIDSALCRISYVGNNNIGEIRVVNSTGGNGSFSDYVYSNFVWNYPVGNTTVGKILSNLTGGDYLLTVKDTKGCTYDSLINVPVKTRYNYIADAGSDTTVCYDNPVILHANVSGGDNDLTFTYEWYLYPDISGQPLSTDPDFEIVTTGVSRYFLRVVDSDGACQDTSSIYVTAFPDIGLEVPLYISAVQDTIISVLMGKEFNMDVIVKDVSSDMEFQWKPAEMFIPSNSWNSTLILNTEIMSQIPADRIVTLQDPITRRRTEYILVDVIAKTVDNGCIDSIRLYARVVDDLAFGNVFSPNGDGINDRWSVPKSYLFPDLEIEIFNRWGSLVWSAKGDEAAKGWNGKTNNGQELPIGTYYYVVKFNAKAQGSSWKPITGSVTIVK